MKKREALAGSLSSLHLKKMHVKSTFVDYVYLMSMMMRGHDDNDDDDDDNHHDDDSNNNNVDDDRS
jgi:hypothetical protein